MKFINRLLVRLHLRKKPTFSQTLKDACKGDRVILNCPGPQKLATPVFSKVIKRAGSGKSFTQCVDEVLAEKK